MALFLVFALLVLTWIASEVGLWLFRRSRSGSSSGPYSASNIVIWSSAAGALGLGIVSRQQLRWAAIGQSSLLLLWVALAVFLAGIALRWWAIIVLGRFFTSDLAVQSDHRIVRTGPYRFLRHPSYSGLLGCFIASGLSMHNWVSVICVLLPVTAAINHRISVEEKMLEQEFGAEYADYRRRTKRLIPGIY